MDRLAFQQISAIKHKQAHIYRAKCFH